MYLFTRTLARPNTAPITLVREFARPHTAPITMVRWMASGRNIYIKGGSNKQDISPETKKLIEEAKDPDDYSWQLGHGIQEPVEVDLTTEERTRAMQYKVKYKGYRINDGEEKVKYYPLAGEEVDNQPPPAPVLMVQKVKKLHGEPYWNKDYCEQIGLGMPEKIGKLSFLPNTPSVGLLLFKIKHLVKITPVTFPNGMPENFNPDTHGYKLTSKGEFVVTDRPNESLDSIAARASWMKIELEQIKKEARITWDKPWNSPLGNSNYSKDTRWVDTYKAASQFEKNKPKNKKWS